MGKRSGRSKEKKPDRHSLQPFNLQYCLIILVVVLIACGFSSNNYGAKEDDDMRFKEDKKEDCKFPVEPIRVKKVKVAGNFTRVSNLTLIDPITVPVMSVQECGIACNNMVPPCTGITYIAEEELPDHCIMSDKYVEFGEEILEDHPYFDPHMGHFIVTIGEKTMPKCYRSMDDIQNVLKRFIRSTHVSTSTPFTSTVHTSSATPTSTSTDRASTTTSSSIGSTSPPKTETTTGKGVTNETVSIGGTTTTSEKPKGGGETKTAPATTTAGSSLPNTTTTTTGAGTTTTTGYSTTTTSSSAATTTTSTQTTSQQPSSTTTLSRPSCTIRVDGKNIEISEGDEKNFNKTGGKTVRYVDAGADSIKNGGQADESPENLGDTFSSNVDSPTVVCIANVTRQNGTWSQLGNSDNKVTTAYNVIYVRCNCSSLPTTTTHDKAADPTTTTTGIFPTTKTSIGTTELLPKTCAKIYIGKDEFEVRVGMDFKTEYAAHLVMFTGSRNYHISVEVSPSCELTLTMINIGRHPEPKTFKTDLDVDMEDYRGFKDAECFCEK